MENALVYFWIEEELTEFAMTGDHTAWWIPGDYDTQEYNYTESKLNDIRGLYDVAHTGNGLAGEGYNPQAYTITKKKVTSKSILKLKMAKCGGFAVSIRQVPK